MFVRTASPSGTPATITISSPDCTRPASTALRSAISNISSVDDGASVNIGITPQFNIKPRATRSEVSDVFNAVIDGTDATMLSGESANGKYPLESVTTMATIDKNAQTLLNEYGRLNSDSFERNSKTEVMASAVKDAANSMDIKLIVTLTKTGHTARLISKYRPNADILALTFDELTERGLMLNWGVIPMLTDAPSSTDDMFEIAERKAVEAGLVQSGDDIVIVAGVPVGEAVRTNTMRIRTVR